VGMTSFSGMTRLRVNDKRLEILGRFRPSPESEFVVLSTPFPAKAGISQLTTELCLSGESGNSK
jgi:hypothetical protein